MILSVLIMESSQQNAKGIRYLSILKVKLKSGSKNMNKNIT